MGSSSFSAVCLDLPSIPLIVRHNLVLSVLWSMLLTNSLHRLLLRSDVALVISSFIVDSRGEAGSSLRRSSRSSIMAKISVACKAYVFQWGYDGKRPSKVSLGTTSRLSGNQLEDDGSSVCVLSLACIGSSQPS